MEACGFVVRDVGVNLRKNGKILRKTAWPPPKRPVE
jgi:hypothetical protein